MNGPRRFTLLALIALLALGMGLSGCSPVEDPWKGQAGPPRVVVSFPPLYCFVKNVAGEDAGILCLCTDLGPHEYQYNARDIYKVQGANLLLINGLNLDDDFIKLKNVAANKKLTLVKLGDQAIPPAQWRKLDASKADDHGHQHGSYDPHIWLGLPEAILMVERIRDELKKVDPGRAARYDQRAADYKGKLEKLHAKGKEAFAGKANRKLIASHDSLFYFARCFQLEALDSISPAPGIAADAKKINELVKVCKDQQVRVIAIEPQYPPTEAELLKNELHKRGLKETVTVLVDPLETATLADLQDPQWYERKMEENINNLAGALR